MPNPIGYCDELEELQQEFNYQQLADEEQEEIEKFIRFLDQHGYNFHIIEAIRKMLLKGQERKNG